MPTARYGMRFVNGEGTELDFGLPEVIDVFARQGDFGQTPFETVHDQSPTGDEALAGGVTYQRPTLIIPVGLSPNTDQGEKIWDSVDRIINIMRPILSDGSPNRGWFYFERDNTQFITTADTWRLPVTPHPFLIQSGESDNESRYVTELRFRGLSAFWEKDPPVRNNATVISGSWSQTTIVETPGGNAYTWPLWYFDGPSSGTINAITIENLTTGRTLEFTNLGMTTGQTLTVNTAFGAKTAYIGGTSVYHRKSQLSDFFPLMPTSQSIRITKDGTTTSTVRMTYRARRTGF